MFKSKIQNDILYSKHERELRSYLYSKDRGNKYFCEPIPTIDILNKISSLNGRQNKVNKALYHREFAGQDYNFKYSGTTEDDESNSSNVDEDKPNGYQRIGFENSNTEVLSSDEESQELFNNLADSKSGKQTPDYLFKSRTY